MVQEMVYPTNYPDPELQGKPKGMKAVLQERASVWDELSEKCGGRVVGKCKTCSKSQAKKDAERCVVEAKAMGQEENLTDDVLSQADKVVAAPANSWCCMHQVLSLQYDFANEKPLLQHYLEGQVHICMFLPKFHCELNPIEMLWGYAKYCLYFIRNNNHIVSIDLYLQDITSQQMENLQQPKYWCQCVLTCATQPLFGDSFTKAGVIWMLTHMCCLFFVCYIC